MSRIVAISLSVVLLALALAACSKPASNAGAPAAANAGATTPTGAEAAMQPAAASTVVATPGEPPLPDLGEFRIVQVLLGSAVDNEHIVLTDKREFDGKDAIYASVLSIGAHQGLKLSADWRAPDGSIVAKSERALVPDRDLATTFQLRNQAAWPPGDYQVRIAIDGHTVRVENFAVR